MFDVIPLKDHSGWKVFRDPKGEIVRFPPCVQDETYTRKGYQRLKVMPPPETPPPKLEIQDEGGRLVRQVGRPVYDSEYPRVRDNDWQGERCVVIAGGPSLRGFDFERLRGERIITVNRAHEKVPWSNVNISLDWRWWCWTTNGALGRVSQELWRTYKGVKLMIDGDEENPKADDYPPEVQVVPAYPNANKFSVSIEYGLGHGSNSGFAALNLALVLGAEEVYLLGFDMRGEHGKQAHWHDEYPHQQGDPVYKKMIAAFRIALHHIYERWPHVRIVNCNPHSALDAFEFGDLPDKPAMPLFVSFFTPDYADDAERLRRSIDAQGLGCDIERVESLGKWEHNCSFKPSFIRNMRRKHPGRALVWIDADAEVVQRPTLFAKQNGTDFACHWLNEELLSGTLYFAATANATRLMNKWEKLCKENPDTWDQRVLVGALEGWKGTARELPGAYCRIFDNPHQKDIEPVILHHQASRRQRG